VLGEPSGKPLVVGQPAPAGTGTLAAVACANTNRCWAVGEAGPNATPAAPLTVVVATKNGGLKWTAQSVPGSVPPQLTGIACPDTKDCIAVGATGTSLSASEVVLTTQDGGTVWSPAAALPGALNVSAVQCSSVANCSVIVNQGGQFSIARTTDLGQSWRAAGTLPASFLGANDLSCTSSGVCLVAGYVPTTTGRGRGAVALSADDGQTWALATVPSNAGLLRDATCVTASACFAVGTTSTTVGDIVPSQGELLRSADGGHSWTAATSAPSPVEDVFGVACPSARVCAIVGTRWAGQPPVGSGAAAQSRDGGARFAASSAAYVPLPLSALSCPTATACVVVGGNTVGRLQLRSA
jgi:photosystem II stability/assembly factor-like uncharacterized protein